jgi:hypothetical protein
VLPFTQHSAARIRFPMDGVRPVTQRIAVLGAAAAIAREPQTLLDAAPNVRSEPVQARLHRTDILWSMHYL